MALPETLECLSSLLEEGGSVCLYERGDYQTVPRHPDFRFSIFYTRTCIFSVKFDFFPL
jgi:hypothetical protein